MLPFLSDLIFRDLLMVHRYFQYLLYLYLFLFIEDLMSLLDADIHSAHPSVIIDADAMFSEDISYFGYPSFRRSSLSRLGSSRGNFVFISL